MKSGYLILCLTAAMIMLGTFSVNAQDVPGPSKNSSGKWGYKNKAGTLVVDYLYDDARTFSGDMAAVKKSGLWGYINVSGELVVKCLYEDAWYFSDGLAAVKSYDKWGYINKTGTMVIPAIYSDAAEFVDGLAWVKKDGFLGYINSSGETMIPFEYKAAVSFSKGYALAYKDTGWGVINEKGVPMAGASTFIFDDARAFKDGMAPVYSKSQGKWGLVGTDGKLAVDFSFSTPDMDRTTSDYAWAYAATSYANKDKIALAKAVTLIEKNYLSSYEKEKMIPYYELLGEKEKVSEAKKSLRDAKKSARVSSRTGASSADFSIAVAPLKLAMYEAGKYSMHQIPLYAQLRIGTVGLGVRYNTYDQYQDWYRFGAMIRSNKDSTMIYSGGEYSFIMKFMNRSDISRGYKGYGHSGQYYGFEIRYSDLKANAISTTITDADGMPVNFGYPVMISPKIQRYDASFIVGVSNSRKIFFYDMGMNIGAGLKFHDFGSEYDSKDYTFADERLSKGWTPYYLVFRYYIRIGINLF